MSALVASPSLRTSQVDAACQDGVAALALALRVPAFTAVTLGLGVGAHLLAGGAPPTSGGLVVVGTFVAMGWWAVARGEQSLARLTVTLWAMQAVLHVVTAGGGCRASTASVPGTLLGQPLTPGGLGATATDLGAALPGHGAGHAGGAAQVVVSCAGMSHAGMSHAGTGMPSAWMWVMHAVAGLLVAVWLRRGEAVLWRAVRRLLPSLPVVASSPLVCRRTVRVAAAVAGMHVALLVLLGDPRRGPPLPIG